MYPHVRGQVAGHGERLAARVADMRLILRMYPHVRIQVAGLRERLAAGVADIWFFPRVRAYVPSQVARRSKRLAARLTDMLVAALVARVVALVPHVVTPLALRHLCGKLSVDYQLDQS